MNAPVPGSMASLVLGVLSIPLAFMGHLVSLAVVCAVLALLTGFVARGLARRSPDRYAPASPRRALWGIRAGAVGMSCACIMWWAWASGTLFP